MDFLNVKSGDEYANLLIDKLVEYENELPFYQRMDSELFEFWTLEISQKAKESFFNYIIGKKDDYLLTSEEMDECLDVAGLKYTENIVQGLVEKGYLDTYPSDKGENFFKLSEKGQTYLQSMNN